jgi:putative signal transducing protein
MESELVVLRTFENVMNAELAKSALDSAGVDSFIQSDDAGGMRPHLVMNRVRLVVRAADASEASSILAVGD